VQRADDVEVLLAGAVVEQTLAGEGLLHRLEVDGPDARRRRSRGRDRKLEDVQGGARIPVAGACQEAQGVVGDGRLLAAQPPLLVD
jgi:hypothetical protein